MYSLHHLCVVLGVIAFFCKAGNLPAPLDLFALGWAFLALSLLV